MKFNKVNLKLFKSKHFLFLFIFALGVGVLLYQIYVNSIQTSIIEGLGLGLDDSNTQMSNILTMFSGFFQKKCLVGCVRLDGLDKKRCSQTRDENNKKKYECPWICDNKKFNENLKNNPDLARDLSSSDKCSVETETKDCGSCVPNRVFNA
jgi:hypothetical protein